MSNTLKQKNTLQLVTFAVVHSVFLGMFEVGPQKLLSFANSIAKGDWAMLGKLIAVSALAGLVLGMIGWAISKKWKETLIFWQPGDRCLPSSRAFSQIAISDGRINAKRLVDQLGDFPAEPAKQTAMWYGIYRQHMSEPSVEDAHGAYLLYREMTGLIVAAFTILLAAAALLRLPLRLTALASVFLVLEYVVVAFAARHSAEHIVANVLAIASTTDRKHKPSKGRRRRGF